MLNPFKEQFQQRISEQLTSRRCYTTEVLSGPELPTDIGHFLTQALYRRARLEGRDLVNTTSEWFDFDSPDVAHTVEQFTKYLSRMACIPHDAFERMLHSAVNACGDYLAQPITTLTEFAVTDRPGENAAADVRRRVGYFIHYDAILAAARSFLDAFAGEQVERGEFATHLSATLSGDGQLRSAEQWMEMFSPIVSATGFAFGREAHIPIEMVTMFLKEAKQDKLAQALVGPATDMDGMISPDRLSGALKKALEPEIIHPPAAPATLHSRGGGRSERKNDLPLWKQFASEAQTTSDTLRNPGAASAAEPLWKTYRPEDNRDDAAPVADDVSSRAEIELLGDAISRRDRFIADLFRGDARHYAETLHSLSRTSDWETASSILSKDVFRRNAVDIYSESAVAFTNAIERHVRQRS